MTATPTKRDYYEVLGISKDADAKAIKDAFRQLALKYHPDRNKEPGAEERFKEIAEAYAVLSDPKKRADYDAAGFAGMGAFRPEDLFGGINFEDIFEETGFDFDFGRGGLFERFFGRRPSGPPRGANMEVLLEVPLSRISTGGEERVQIAHPQVCPACKGSGAKAGTSPRTCAACEGSGQKVSIRREKGILIEQVTTCPECGGRGQFIDHPCPECQGRGQVQRSETLTVKVPVGAEEGMALRIPGKGLPSETEGLAGDLYVVIRTAPDPRFERSGADLWRMETLEVVDAVLGSRIEVPTLDGPLTVTVPPGTQPGSVLRIPGKGLPEFGGGRKGDLYLRMEVHIPQTLSREEHLLYERLRSLQLRHSRA